MEWLKYFIPLCLLVEVESHASCRINWTFGVECTSVEDAIVSQINKWTGPAGCDAGGEKCLYKLTSKTKDTVLATHKTPKEGYVDDLSFEFKSEGSGCTVKGYSTSETWYAILDYGTNYCNLHNLITGSGLDKVQGYKEVTSNSVCTQYSSANCDKY